MKKLMMAAVVVASLALATLGALGSGGKDLQQYPQCLHCGMNRQSCAHTRMTVEYSDGTKGAECSLHCLLAELASQPGRTPKRILAADYNDKTLAAADRSWWVRYDNAVECAGSKVMLAFRSEAAADKFITSYGGKKLTYDQALNVAYRDIEQKTGHK